MKLRPFSRRWTVLNYVVTEPNTWTVRLIAEDLDARLSAINEARHTLTRNGLIAKGNKLGKAHTLIPTPEGVELFQRSLGK
jgi:DNA-binding IclR family transcriptional regulator